MKDKIKAALRRGDLYEVKIIMKKINSENGISALLDLVKAIDSTDFDILKGNEQNPNWEFAGYGGAMLPPDNKYKYRMDIDDKYVERLERIPAIGSYLACLTFVNNIRKILDLEPLCSEFASDRSIHGQATSAPSPSTETKVIANENTETRLQTWRIKKPFSIADFAKQYFKNNNKKPQTNRNQQAFWDMSKYQLFLNIITSLAYYEPVKKGCIAPIIHDRDCFDTTTQLYRSRLLSFSNKMTRGITSIEEQKSTIPTSPKPSVFFTKQSDGMTAVKLNPYIHEIILHNDDTGQTFRDVVTSATITILQSSGEIVYKGEMKAATKENETSFSVQMDKKLLFTNNLSSDDQICINKNLLTSVSLPAKIIVSGSTYDAWSENLYNSSKFSKELIIDNLDNTNIEDGRVIISFNKTISLKNPSHNDITKNIGTGKMRSSRT